MVEYLYQVLNSLLTPLFIVFVVCALGYLVGAIKIKGISLGSAGVLLVAILVGVLFSYVPDIKLGEKTIELWGASDESVLSTISNIGTVLFVTAVGLIAGPKFFRSFNKSMMSYVFMGAVIVALGIGITVFLSWIDKDMSVAMGTGLLSGSLTSTPAFGAAKESAGLAAGEVTAGYGIGYLYGVLGVVLFVQIMPKILKVDIAKEREHFVAANTIQIKDDGKKRFALEEFGFFPFFITIALGLLIGCVKVPIGGGNYFSFGSSGGTLIAGLIVGHFGHFGKIDMKVSKKTLNFFRELGLVLFLVGAGIPGGVRFVSSFDWIYIVYGIIMATVPMIVGFLLGKFVFKLSIFNNLGSITGGMTSTPALGSLISVAGTDDVSSAYAATYPFALVLIVVSCNLLVLLPF
ncbi:MAG: YidE/YbjL duplication [Clostridia bacterium]|nr:YidE/YbjL duplication [Clostridia bacterium]MBQ8876948.1 YidE/YbjL duplication [Clostridia bacterium]